MFNILVGFENSDLEITYRKQKRFAMVLGLRNLKVFLNNGSSKRRSPFSLYSIDVHKTLVFDLTLLPQFDPCLLAYVLQFFLTRHNTLQPYIFKLLILIPFLLIGPHRVLLSLYFQNLLLQLFLQLLKHYSIMKILIFGQNVVDFLKHFLVFYIGTSLIKVNNSIIRTLPFGLINLMVFITLSVRTMYTPSLNLCLLPGVANRSPCDTYFPNSFAPYIFLVFTLIE